MLSWRFPWPMTEDGYAFLDHVAAKPVYYWIDRNGKRWLAYGRWSFSRMRRETKHTTVDQKRQSTKPDASRQTSTRPIRPATGQKQAGN